MRFRIYMSVDGDDFDAEAFNRSVNNDIHGEVVHRKNNRRNPSQPPVPFWKTAEIVTSSNKPEDELERLLERAKSIFARSATDDLEITAEIVAEYELGEEPRGFYFNPAILRMLSQLGAQLDIDAVPRMSD
jgi:hypothetical protein